MSKQRGLGATEADQNHLYEKFVQMKPLSPNQPYEKLVRLRPSFPKGGGNLPPPFAWPPQHSTRDNLSRVDHGNSQAIGNADRHLAQGRGQFVTPLAVLNDWSGQTHEQVAWGALGVQADAYRKEPRYE